MKKFVAMAIVAMISLFALATALNETDEINVTIDDNDSMDGSDDDAIYVITDEDEILEEDEEDEVMEMLEEENETEYNTTMLNTSMNTSVNTSINTSRNTSNTSNYTNNMSSNRSNRTRSGSNVNIYNTYNNYYDDESNTSTISRYYNYIVSNIRGGGEIIELTGFNDGIVNGYMRINGGYTRADRNVVINIYLDDVTLPAGRVLEAWLVDNDTGYELSLGTLATSSAGRARLSSKQAVSSFRAYDEIKITSELVNDPDPRPDMTVSTDVIPGSMHGNMFSMRVDLDGASETPGVSTMANGIGYFLIDTTAHTLTYNITYEDLSSEETATHFHGVAPEGYDADPVFELPSGMEKNGVWTYPENLTNAILAGQIYLNVHSTSNPDGEIRGQIELE